MESSASHTYAEMQILTATPQKLRLMLIEGAIRYARQSAACLDQQRFEAAFDANVRCRDILFALLSGVQKSGADLNREIASLYIYLYRTVIEASRYRDKSRLENIIRVLEVERETWRQLCEQMPEHLAPPDHASPPTEITAGHLAAIHSPHYGPAAPLGNPADLPFSRGNTLSLDA